MRLHARGLQTAARFLGAADVAAGKAVEELLRSAEAASLTADDRKLCRALQRRAARARATHDGLGAQPGWAKEIAGKNPRFDCLEKLAHLDERRPEYRAASQRVHAGPTGTVLSLFDPGRPDALTVGPKPDDLYSPAYLTVTSLGDATRTLLSVLPVPGRDGLEQELLGRLVEHLVMEGLLQLARCRARIDLTGYPPTLVEA